MSFLGRQFLWEKFDHCQASKKIIVKWQSNNIVFTIFVDMICNK